ncbi:salivary glue protein Sgs-3 [Zeugodacus cucurbitae]|nr:salivary glue protein Sgs-3 [Zeugodacus cucurbitae]
MWKISFTTVILAILLTARLCNGDCNVCNENNGAACVSNITFQLCFGGIPQGTIYSCPTIGDVCTRLGLICADPAASSTVQADCGNTEQCGQCVGVPNGGYACTSHTTFVMCQGEQPSSVSGTCPSNEVCLTSRANIGVNPCANQCLSNIQDICDIESPNTPTVTPITESPTTESPTTESPTTESPTTESPTTESPTTESPTTESPTTESSTTESPTTESPTTESPTTESPTTESSTTESPTTESPTTESPTTESPTTESPTTESPTTESSSSSSTGTTLSVEDTVCAGQTLVGRYRNPNDATCRTYVYCRMDRTTRKLVGRPMTCPGTRFFNQSINNCQDALPAGCTQ